MQVPQSVNVLSEVTLPTMAKTGSIALFHRARAIFLNKETLLPRVVSGLPGRGRWSLLVKWQLGLPPTFTARSPGHGACRSFTKLHAETRALAASCQALAVSRPLWDVGDVATVQSLGEGSRALCMSARHQTLTPRFSIAPNPTQWSVIQTQAAALDS